MNLPRLRISTALGFGLVLATVIVLGCATRSAPKVHIAPLAAATPRAGANALPTALVPAVAQALAASHPELWRAQVTKAHAVEFNNPAQHVRARFDRSGVQLQFNGAEPAQLGMQLLALQSGKTNYRVTTSKPVARGNRVELAHGHGLSEWYENSPLGIEQGFTLDQPPNKSHTLVLSLRVQGALKPVLKNNAIEFQDTRDKPVLHYGDLLAYDAQHHALPARMRLTGSNLELAINTHGARYPITIDPLFSVTTSLTEPGSASGDHFGFAVAISADGNTALIGAYGTAVNGNANAGKAYVFTATNGTWSTTPVATFSDPAAATNDQFGSSVALSADGSTALIGADGTAMISQTFAGEAYVYSAANGVWSKTASLRAPGAAANDVFGASVALSADGSIALIGAWGTTVNGQNGAGESYVFSAANGAWSKTASFPDPPAAAGDAFGSSVALSADGSTALIGARGTSNGSNPSVGKAYVFHAAGGIWPSSPTATFTDSTTNPDQFGSAVALSADGQTALIGAKGTTLNSITGAGAAALYKATNNAWTITPAAVFTDPPAAAYDSFGDAVALSADGNTAIIGALGTTVNGKGGAGAAYVFNAVNGSWSNTPTNTLTDLPAGANDQFGNSVVLSADSQTVLIGAFNSDVNGNLSVGEAYVFSTPVDMSLALSSNPASGTVAGSVTYMLTVTNSDTVVTASNLSLVDTLPAGMTYVSSSAAGGACTNASGTVTCTLASLAPQATWQPSITVTAGSAGSIKNTASVTATQADPNTANNSASVTTNVTVPAPVASDGSVTTDAGKAVNGTLAATGTGPLTFAIAAQPGHGTVTITNAATGAFTYTPASGFSGSDSFTFTVNNSGGASNTATESVTVKASAGGSGGGNGGGGGSSGGGGTSSGGGGGAFGLLSLLLLAPMLRRRNRGGQSTSA